MTVPPTPEIQDPIYCVNLFYDKVMLFGTSCIGEGGQIILKKTFTLGIMVKRMISPQNFLLILMNEIQ